MARYLKTKNLIMETNVGRETIRFYERKGLIPLPRRNESGYREYPSETVQIIQFIKSSQEAGFTLAEIKDFLTIDKTGKITKEKVVAIIDSKILSVNKKLDSLILIKTVLENLRNQTMKSRSESIVCPILGKIKFCNTNGKI